MNDFEHDAPGYDGTWPMALLLLGVGDLVAVSAAGYVAGFRVAMMMASTAGATVVLLALATVRLHRRRGGLGAAFVGAVAAASLVVAGDAPPREAGALAAAGATLLAAALVAISIAATPRAHLMAYLPIERDRAPWPGDDQ